MYEVTQRDGAARIGKLSLEERNVITPTLLLIENERFRVDLPSNVNLLSIEMKEEEPGLLGRTWDEIIEINRAEQLSGDPADTAKTLVTSKELAGYGRALYTPGTGLVQEYAQMVYCGVDLMDASRLVQEARRGNYLSPDGSVNIAMREGISCFCPACTLEGGRGGRGKEGQGDGQGRGERGKEGQGDGQGREGRGKEGQGDGEGRERDRVGFPDILLHNILSALEELSTIRRYISRGRLRHLVEMRIRARPEAVSIQRILDRDHYPFFRERLGFTGGRVVGVSENTLQEPVVRRYRERLEGYRKPDGELLVLLPCSARKPYSISRSHRLFRNVLERYQGSVHEVIVTSPLGLVPRELENFHPAASYDISVTGEWSFAEKEMIRDMLSGFLANNSYSAIINHTPYSFVSDHLHELAEKGIEVQVLDTVRDGRATSSSSLRNLGQALGALSGSLAHPSMGSWKASSFRNMWEFQFGRGSGTMLAGTKVTGRFPFLKLSGSEGQMAMMVPRSNRISLTLNGAEILCRMKRNRVFIEDFTPTGDVFAVGVVHADRGIRVGEEVVVVHEKDMTMNRPGWDGHIRNGSGHGKEKEGRVGTENDGSETVDTAMMEEIGRDMEEGVPNIHLRGDGEAVMNGEEGKPDTHLRGGGVAVMNGEEMMEATRGIAVKLRHRMKD